MLVDAADAREGRSVRELFKLLLHDHYKKGSGWCHSLFLIFFSRPKNFEYLLYDAMFQDPPASPPITLK